MKFRTLKNWPVGGDLSALLFFAQRMEELLFDYSLDTFKPAALNAAALCSEAMLVLTDIELNILDEAHLPHILDELEWSIQSDPVAKSLMEADLGRYIPRHKDTPLPEKKLKLEVLSGVLNLHRYMNRCIELLQEAISAKSKHEIDALARTLCTTLINLGQSKCFLYKAVLDYFYYDDGQFDDCITGFQGFIKRIFPFTHHFNIYFIVTDLINTINEENSHFKVERVDALPEDLVAFAKENNFNPHANEVIIRIEEIQSFDIYSAREEAEKKLSEVRDFFILFHHKSQVVWRDEALVVQLCCEEVPTIVSKPRSSMEKGGDLKPAVASKRMNRMLKSLNLANDGSFERFSRVVELHGIGVTNNIPENQLLNLWVSLETITPSHVGKSKLSSVIANLKPILMLNYINRLIERTASDLINWDRPKALKMLKKAALSKDRNIRLNLLKLLAVDEHLEIRTELYKGLGDFHLLRYRLFRLSEMLSDPEKIKSLLQTHDKKISWQIRRIYRTRNLIVHSGQSPTFIHTLIENGHDYLDQVFGQIMLTSCGEHHLNSLDQVFELAKIRYERFERMLTETKKFDNENLIFLLGNVAFPTTEPPQWIFSA